MAKKQIVCLIASVFLLAGCSGVKEQLGLTRNSPDEFTVVKRAPLTLPPEYSLRPPSDDYTAQSRSAGSFMSSREQARSTVFGSQNRPAGQEENLNAESAFARQAGISEANPEIRRVISEENGYIVLEDQSTVDKILGKTPKTIKEPVVDATAEAERLRENAQAGKPLTEGDVPTIEKKKSTIDKLF